MPPQLRAAWLNSHYPTLEQGRAEGICHLAACTKEQVEPSGLPLSPLLLCPSGVQQSCPSLEEQEGRVAPRPKHPQKRAQWRHPKAQQLAVLSSAHS